MAINLGNKCHGACFMRLKQCCPQMLERGEGYLMNTASAAGLLTTLGAAPYTVTKSAAVSFAEWVKIT